MTTNTTPRALLTLRITPDHGGEPLRPIYSYIRLYREDDGLVWRIDGPLGDEVEVLPRPATVEQAKADARAVYLRNGPFAPAASWL